MRRLRSICVFEAVSAIRIDWAASSTSARLAVIFLFITGLLFGQPPITFQYVYDNLNQLVRVVDSTGASVQYVYDALGNVTQINRSSMSPSAPAIFNASPSSAFPGSVITIQGQGFSPTASLDIVTIGGIAATVISATSTTLIVVIPADAVSGVISVTVGSNTTASSSNETILPLPVITSVRPHVAQVGVGNTISVKGANLGGAMFSVSQNPAIAVTSSPSPDGTSALLHVLATSNVTGNFAIVASIGSSNSGLTPTLANSIGIFTDPTADPDNDGLPNGNELILGTNPYLADTDGDTFPDGVEVASRSDPLDPNCTPLNCRVSNEIESVTVSVANTAGQPGNSGGSSNESEGVDFSVLNTSSPRGTPSGSSSETESVAFSILNTSVPQGSSPGSSSETESVVFSVLNMMNLSTYLSETDSTTFSVCDGGLSACSGFASSLTRPRPRNPAQITSPSQPSSNGPGSREVAALERPNVAVVAPGSSATGIGTNTPVTLVFSEAMDASTLNAKNLIIRAGDKPVDAHVVISSDFRVATLTGMWPASSEITVEATGNVESLFGATLPDFQSHFNTGPANSLPPVLRQFPATGAGGVPPDVPILIEAQSQNLNTAELTVLQNGEATRGATNANQTEIRFQPEAPFPPGAVIALHLRAQAADLNAGVEESGAFVVAGSGQSVASPVRVYPGKAADVPLDPAIEIEYDRALDPESVTSDNASLRLASGEGFIPLLVTLRGDHVIRLLPLATLTPLTEFYYEISSRVRDSSGEAVRAFGGTFRTTNQVDSVTHNGPQAKPTGIETVDPAGPFVVPFERPFNPVSVTPEAIQLNVGRLGRIPVAIGFAENFRQIVVTPLQPLPEGAEITLATSGIEDTAGRPLVPTIAQYVTRSGPARTIEPAGERR